MKQSFKLKSLIMSMAIAGSSVAVLAPASAQAELTGNIGLMSQYYFRGIEQSPGVSPEAGIDYESELGFFLGAWTAKVDDEDIEYDLYGGYEVDLNGFTLGAGLTLYRYVEGDFDTAYDEINIWAGYGPLSVAYDRGINRKGSAGPDKDLDYSVLSATLDYAGAFATYGKGFDFAGEDTDHTWLEVGYATEVYQGTDVSFSVLHSSKEVFDDNKAKTTLLFGINKSFNLM